MVDNTEQRAAPIKLPKPLATWQVVVYTIMLPVCFTAFIASIFGLWALTDHDRKAWISQTKFADHYRALIEWNQMCSMIFFNGGMLGTIICFSALRQHRQGNLLKNVRFLSPSEVVKEKKLGEKKRR